MSSLRKIKKSNLKPKQKNEIKFIMNEDKNLFKYKKIDPKNLSKNNVLINTYSTSTF